MGIERITRVELTDESCFLNIFRDILGNENRGSLGIIVGRKFRGNYRLINSFAWRSAETDEDYEDFGDFFELKRIIHHGEVLKSCGAKYGPIGTYHTEVKKPRETREVWSKDDRKWLKHLSKTAFVLKETVHLVGSVRIKDKPAEKVEGEETIYYGRRLGKITTLNKTVYDVTLSAYLITPRGSRLVPLSENLRL